MSDWPAESIQLVWFTASANTLNAATLFSDLVGAPAETTQNNRSPTPTAPFFSKASGVEGDAFYDVTVQPGRVDFIAKPREPNVIVPVPLMPDTAGSIAAFLNRAMAVPDLVPDVNRLALVLNVAQLAQSQSEATWMVADRIGGLPPLTSPSDLLFQINSRKGFRGLSGLQMNRLLRFSVSGYQKLAFQVGPGAATTVPLTEATFAAALVVDVNTVPRVKVFSSTEIVSIWKELHQEALRLRAEGSVKGLLS